MRSAATSSWLRKARRLALAAAAVGVALWAVPPAAAQTRSSPTRPAQADVRSLARALEMQLHLVHRNNLPEYALRSEQLHSAVDAWRRSAQTAAERDAITGWLRQSIRNSMPGSHAALPPLPEFTSAAQVVQAQQARPGVYAQGPARPTSRSVLRPAAGASADSRGTPTTDSSLHWQTAKTKLGGIEIQADVATVKQPHEPAHGKVENETAEGPSLWDRHPSAELSLPDVSEGDPFLDDPISPDFDLPTPSNSQ